MKLKNEEPILILFEPLISHLLEASRNLFDIGTDENEELQFEHTYTELP